MKFNVKFEDFTDSNSIDLICEKLKGIKEEGSYNLVLEYNNHIDELVFLDDEFLEVKPEHLRYLKDCRQKCTDLNFDLKNIYLLGQTDYSSSKGLKVTLEKTSQREAGKNVYWPTKQMFLFDNGKRDLDARLQANEIDYEEYETRLRILQADLGFMDSIEEDYYIH